MKALAVRFFEAYGQPASGQRLDDAEDVRGSGSDVLVIGPARAPRSHRLGRPCWVEQLDGPFVEADDGAHFSGTDERTARVRPPCDRRSPDRSAERTTFFSRQGFNSCLASTTRIASRPTVSTIRRWTTSSAKRRTVHRVRPCGGGPQTRATIAASCVLSNLRSGWGRGVVGESMLQPAVQVPLCHP